MRPCFFVSLLIYVCSSTCTFELPDAASGLVTIHVPFCRTCRKHRVIDTVLLLARDLSVSSLSDTLQYSPVSSLLSPHVPGTPVSDVIARFAVVWYGMSTEGHLRLWRGADFTVNLDTIGRALEEPVLATPLFSDNETVYSLASSATLKAIRVVLSNATSPSLSWFQSASSELVPVTHLVVSAVAAPPEASDPDNASIKKEAEAQKLLKKQRRDDKRHDMRLQSTLKAIVRYANSSRLFMTLLTNASSVLGDPSLEDCYGDCSGFNREQTLRNLKNSNSDRSLQQALLAAGYRVRVFDDPGKAKGYTECRHQLFHPERLSSSVYVTLEDLYCCNLSSSSVASDPIVCETSASCSSAALPACFYPISEDNAIGRCKEEDSAPVGSKTMTESNSIMADTDTTASTKGSLLRSDPKNLGSFTERQLIKTRLEAVIWDENKPFAQELALGGKPVILRGAQPASWTALHRWSPEYFSRYLENSTFTDVKLAPRNITHHKFYDADARTAMNTLIDFQLPFSITNMNSSDFFRLYTDESASEMAYYFTALPREFRSDVLPDSLMFLTEKDKHMQMKYLWMSSAGVNLHTHFDQDHNFFVQIAGQKRFILFPPSEMDHLYPFPRTHPLWHKAQADFHNPDLATFPSYRSARAWEALLEPGDLLYIPPYWWHFVSARTASISVSTWSKREHVEDCMNYVYGHEHKFDMLSHPKGRLYALRLYLDMMVEGIYGAGSSTLFFHRLWKTRYASFAISSSVTVCSSEPVPIARHVYGDTNLDVVLGQTKFAVLAPEIRDFIFMDYCEELVANVLSANMTASFFGQCFLGQTYAFRDDDEDGSYLWAYK